MNDLPLPPAAPAATVAANPVRRPISFRGTRLAAAMAKALASTGIAPNTISFCGPVFSLIGGIALW